MFVMRKTLSPNFYKVWAIYLVSCEAKSCVQKV